MTVFLSEFEHLTLDDSDPPSELYYAPTDNGLRFSVAVPLADAEAPLDALASQQFGYLVYLGGVIALLTLLGLWRLVPALQNLRASCTDKLTGLPNRLQLMRDLEKNSSVTLVLLNLDRFREVNSLFGDSCGDLILKEVALRLESFLSGTDHSRARLYRVGGDEFAISLPRRRPVIVEQQLEEMLSCVRRSPVIWQNHEIGLSATIGAVVPWLETPQEHSLYIHAREALREARIRGLHCRVYDGSESLEQEFEHNQKWAGKLRDALDTEGLIAWYQPILNNTTGRIDKYECLVRMLDHKDGEVIGPGNFLGVAGKLRLEGHITRVMVEKCFTRFADTGTQFSINLSYSDLLQEELKAFILQRLDETGVGRQVIFELLETANIENYEQVRAFVQEVKKRGCRIAIDDFGTGYSNFEHLLQLQVDFIKIDGSLIRNLDKDPNSRRVARGIVGLARSMKIETVAEYVHSPAVQMEVLRLGISFSQGELIGMPSPELRVEIPSELTRLSYSGRNMARSMLKV
ncbi:EAL domain-containing protein [Marinobacterium stanieri]|uniref:EAL domain-containing protein n=1 Tax=Marinobacterium stanieri TaxID=49186 RepID=UPI003A92A911